MKRLLCLLLLSCFPSLLRAESFIPPNDPLIQYSGRVDFSNPRSPQFDWPGVSLSVRFQGPALRFLLVGGRNFFDVQVDGRTVTVWGPATPPGQYLLKGLPPGEHRVRVVRRTEPCLGPCLFRGLVLPEGTTLLAPPPLPRRKIEILGDSWACGYGNLSSTREVDDRRKYEDADLSFGAWVSRDLAAEYHLEAFSGKGVVRNSQDPKRRSVEPFPPLFERTLCGHPQETWDFSRWTPDAVILHLGLNDFANEPQARPRDFQAAYLSFLERLRRVYPKASLFCMATTTTAFRKDLAGLVRQAVGERRGLGDSRVFFVGYPMPPPEELGSANHPKLSAHRKLAALVEKALRREMGW